MTKTLTLFIKISITSSLLSSVLIFSQDQCPPEFISGVPLDQSIALAWEKPDTLAGYGVEVYSHCFTTCSSEGLRSSTLARTAQAVGSEIMRDLPLTVTAICTRVVMLPTSPG